MLELPTHDRDANVPPTPSNDALTIMREKHDALDQTSPRPSKRHCPSPYISPSSGHAAAEVHLLADAETKPVAEAEAIPEAEATPKAEAIIEAEAITEAEATPAAGVKAGITPEAGAEAKAEAEAAQVLYPLTAENLATLPDYFHPSTPSILTSTASTSLSLHRPDHVGTYSLKEMTVADARTLLNRNHLYLFDSDAQKRAKDIIKAGNQIRERRRKSSMSEPIKEALVETIKYFANKGERTFMVNLWKTLLNDDRQVPDRELTFEDDPELFEWAAKAWAKDNLYGKWEADFARDNCPTLEKTGDPILDAVLLTVPRITSPRPDLAYGFDFTAFEEAHGAILHEVLGGKITKQQFCTFFAVEAKCGEGSIEDAENQCCRTGATMAKSRRDMNRAMVKQKTILQDLRASMATPSQSTEPVAPTSGHTAPTQVPSSVEQPPLASNAPTQHMDTISFTLAVCPQIAKMSIHFAETWPSGRTEWQMHGLKSYLLEERDHLQALRHDIDNILDWGCTTRKKQITVQAAELAQIALDIQEVEEAKSAMEVAQAKVSTPGSKRKRGGP